jgi:23S rRNA G2069 N7-methylase RlmK/C1962 C5-methylase RlmI
VGSAVNARSNFLPTHKDVGSAVNARSNFLPTHKDVGSAVNAGATFHKFVREDCLKWMQQAIKDNQKYQLIFIDPPTFSNSKKMETSLDINRDHTALLSGCLALLADDGLIIFSTNARSFKLDSSIKEDCFIREITAKTTTEDFRRKPLHRCWCLALQEEALEACL